MLFGEYLVLKGSNCLAFPLKFGQQLSVEKSEHFSWKSYDRHGVWFELKMDHDLNIIETNNSDAADMLRNLFQIIREKNPSIDVINQYEAKANFELNWGLGSSSTLISLLSQWSQVDANTLLTASFGGSGYDVACATANDAIVFADGKVINEVKLAPQITNQLLFIYLGQKQNSREEIKRFKSADVTSMDIEKMNALISTSIQTDKIELFEKQLNESEDLISKIIGSPKLKDRFFTDYTYSIKSLGAWGGDFFLATYRNLDEAKTYFKSKGFETMFTYTELIK